jgi:hypothetical protein
MTAEISKIIAIGELSIEHWIANVDVRLAKEAYHDAIHAYEEAGGLGRVRTDDIAFRCVQVATRHEYAAYKAAKRVAHNIGRRLDTAIRNYPKF